MGIVLAIIKGPTVDPKPQALLIDVRAPSDATSNETWGPNPSLSFVGFLFVKIIKASVRNLDATYSKRGFGA